MRFMRLDSGYNKLIIINGTDSAEVLGWSPIEAPNSFLDFLCLQLVNYISVHTV